MKSLIEELKATTPTQQRSGDWFNVLSPADQQEIADAARRKAAGELPHSWFQIASVVKSRLGLTPSAKYIAGKLVQMGAECQPEKRSRTK